MSLILLLVMFVVQDDSPRAVLLTGTAQGTTYHIKFVAPAKPIDTQRLQADIEKVLAEIDRQMSTYRPDSEISRFNRAPADQWFAVSSAVAEVVSASREISEKSGGAQDITVAPLVKLWHFGPRSKAPSPRPLPGREGVLRPPKDAEVQSARDRVGYKKLEVRMNPPALRKQVKGLEVDLSSIASGYTIDKLAGLFRERGIANYLIELGGELRAAGKRADGTPWRVAVERPIAEKREMESAVPVEDAAMATAGGSRHFFEYEGRRYSHIIDPATGRPVEHTLSSVTVAADKCIDADGWDTPLMVMGPERGSECAERLGIAAMFIRHADRGGADEVKTTSAWRKRFGGK